jgi:hypothetical protein
MAKIMNTFMYRYLTLYVVPDKTHCSILQVKIYLITMMLTCDDHQFRRKPSEIL